MALLSIRISHHSPKAEPSASEAVVDLDSLRWLTRFIAVCVSKTRALQHHCFYAYPWEKIANSDTYATLSSGVTQTLAQIESV